MGVCPQFDVLWDELSGRQHLIIYGLVKGLSFDQVSSMIKTFWG
jgi:ABC-type multidrug transport system ATPase subunit